MDITPDKISQILSDPQKLSMISSLVSMMSKQEEIPQKNDSDMVDNSKHTETNDLIEKDLVDESNKNNSLVELASFNANNNKAGGIDVSAISDLITNMNQNVGFDRRINLLKAVRPFLSDSKKNKVDSLTKALGAAKLIERMKDIDILKLF